MQTPMSSYISFKYKIHFTFQILDCVGPLNPEVVQSTPWASDSPASNVLNLGEDYFPNGTSNIWVDGHETIGQGFTIRVDSCSRMITGCQIKNAGNERHLFSTKGFKVSGSRNENGPWQPLVENELEDTSEFKPASLLNFTFDNPVQIQFLKFEVVSYWISGGALQYFAAIPLTSKYHTTIKNCLVCLFIPE